MLIDIYFDKNYAQLYEKVENGKVVSWEFNGQEGKISHLFIKRAIPIKLDQDKQYFDLITPYGYGGPLINKINTGYSRNDLLKVFQEEFTKYCQQEKIVAEFVRFHPLVENALDFKEIYNAKCIRKTLGNNLDNVEGIFEREINKRARQRIRKCLKDGMNYEFVLSPNDLEIFKNIYYQTMDRNKASDYYYFDDEYFSKLLKYFKDNILLTNIIFEGKIIHSSISLLYNDYLHVHLSGTDLDYLNYSPAYLSKYAVMEWAVDHKLKYIHYGGGKSNAIDDPLYLYKKKFAQTTEFDFYVGSKIWDEDIYEKLCNAVNIKKNIEFFPAYRKVL